MAPNLDPTQASSYELGWTYNPITGCLNHDNGLCKGGGFPCYAYRLANGRLKQRYLANDNWPKMILNAGEIDYPVGYHPSQDPFYPRFWEERLEDIKPVPSYEGRFNSGIRSALIESKRKGIFVCDMGDLFGIGVPEDWTSRIMDAIWDNDEYDRFYLLTKQPQNLIRFSPFPDNCWVGVTATNGRMVDDAGYYLEQIDAKVKFLSLEPLLEPMLLFFGKPTIDWLIIGACTGTGIEMLRLAEAYKREDGSVMPYGNKFTLQPKIEWVQEIVEAADKAGVKVFLKDNLWPLLTGHPEFWEDIPQGNHPNYESIAELRQEMPTDGV